MKKKTTGLKKELKSRHKTMSQPDIKHNFNSLGIWRESTLKELADNFCARVDGNRIFPYRSIDAIEKKYLVKDRILQLRLKKNNSKRFFFPTLECISEYIKTKKTAERLIEILQSDYNKYIETMIKLMSKNNA